MKLLGIILTFAAAVSLLLASAVSVSAEDGLNKTQLRLAVGEKYTLTLKTSGENTKWSSSDKNTASVSSSGKVTAISKGTAVITASVSGKSYSCKVTVVPFRIAAPSSSLEKGGTLKLSIKGKAENIKWSSSDKSIAVVSSAGKVTAKNTGTVKISATDGKYKTTVTLNVKGGNMTNMTNMTNITDIIKNKIYVSDGRFMANGGEIWINGVNTPWDNWNDFGGGFDADFWDGHFKKLAEAGVNASRIWIICSGDVGIKIDAEGNVTGATDKFWEDLDSLIKLAEKHKIYIMATAQSFDCYKEGNSNYLAWRAMITDKKKTDKYVENFIVPLVKRYDGNPYFWSVDLMNEPDWVYENEACGKISWDNISYYFAKAAEQIHKNSGVLVTTGMAVIKYNSDVYGTNMVSNQYLKKLSGDSLSFMDFWSPHWYSWMEPWWKYPFDVSPSEFGLTGDRPALIGECSAKSSENRKLADDYKGAYTNGWSGIMPWTSNGVDSNGGYDEIAPAAKEIAKLNAKK